MEEDFPDSPTTDTRGVLGDLFLSRVIVTEYVVSQFWFVSQSFLLSDQRPGSLLSPTLSRMILLDK